MNNLITISFLIILLLSACNKDTSYTITVENPESFPINVGSGSFVGSIVPGNSSETYSGTEKHGQDNVVSISSSYDSNGDGEMYTVYDGITFSVTPDGEYFHVLGSQVVAKI